MKKSMVMFVLIFVEMYGQLDASYCRGMSKDLKRLNDADRFWRQLCEDEEKAEKLLFLKRGVMVARLVVHGNLLPIAVRKSLIEFKDECLTKKNRNDIYNVLISVHDRVWIR